MIWPTVDLAAGIRGSRKQQLQDEQYDELRREIASGGRRVLDQRR